MTFSSLGHVSCRMLQAVLAGLAAVVAPKEKTPLPSAKLGRVRAALRRSLAGV